jgi:uncharacterized membrane protein
VRELGNPSKEDIAMSVTEGARKSRRKAADTAEDTADRVEKQAPKGEDQNGEGREDQGRSGGGETLTSELKSTVREAALEVLKPVARKATVSAAKLAVTHGPGLVKDKVAPKVTDKVADAGGMGAMAKDLASKGGDMGGELTEKLPFMGGGKGGGKSRSASGTGRGRRLPVQEYVDVAASIDVVYDQFTQFEEFPKFMHRVERIEQRDDTTLMWHENIWGIRRQWEAEITDQEPCKRIAWRSDSVETIGVVTFHKLADNLTRVYMTVDFQPKGILEKTASGFRMSRRAIKSDLMRFKAFVEMRDEATGEWRGRIEEGEVAEAEGGEGEEREEREEPRAEEEEEYEDEEEEEEPRAEEEEYEDEDEEEERETAPRRRGRFARSRDEDEEEYEDEEEEQEPVAEEREPAQRPRPRRRPRSGSTGRER